LIFLQFDHAFDTRRRGVFMHPVFVSAGKKTQATPIWFVHSGNLDSVQKEIGERARAFVATCRFRGESGPVAAAAGWRRKSSPACCSGSKNPATAK
jgi:hypothetical protein